MRIATTVTVLGIAFAAATASAQAPAANAMLLAQAHDRCLATYAVRLTRTPATDEAIFAEANVGCRAVSDQLGAAIEGEYPAADAAKLKAMLDAQAKPNFMQLLQRIRADRLSRAGQ